MNEYIKKERGFSVSDWSRVIKGREAKEKRKKIRG